MLKALLLPLLALAGGVGGFCLRHWELSTAFESSGLAIPWAPASIAMIVLSVAMAAVFALLCWGRKNELSNYDDAFCATANWAYLVISAIASACLLTAGVFGFLKEFHKEGINFLQLLLWALCILSFICVVVTVLGNFHTKSRRYSMVLLVPAYMCCVWLVTAYQRRASDPVVQDYVYELFAIICTLLGFYFAAGFSFDRARVRRCAFFCLLTVYFNIVTLADTHDQPFRLLHIFSVLYQLPSVSILLYNTFANKPKHLGSQNELSQEVTPDE